MSKEMVGITNDECFVLNDLLGNSTPGGCFALAHVNKGDDAFTMPTKGDAFKDADAEVHRNSWLWPRLARRITKNSDFHVSKWRKPVEVDSSQCKVLLAALTKHVGAKEAKLKLPKGCKDHV
mmetsp:Transcript_21720/g.66930  ORF Transcript_21720/g.66930 Transcript_21720/m.66930 type:complete len:122 (-) Transcript_21720:181-546(-)|eukprot:CAMPEP_0198288412 /NCGR_PEP_ID=MMETSP1449-20131203/6902_1 /TAXON_ID=420275 /ORGANISM="Attheya septentrionalis, Strain CCMP2084" /LENGTH=121 /DNA_ID=CAMNT_0043986539 /DNA_START=14 /DNA_END=379 /DNA_ORIENTATION=-